MKRKIHLVGSISAVILYIAIGLLVNAYIKTNQDHVATETYRVQWLIAVASILVISIAAIMTLGTGATMLMNLENSSQAYRKINVITAIIYLFGGLGICIFFSLYLYIKE